MDDVRTMTREYRQYPEYSEIFSTRRADDRFEDHPQRKSTLVKWGGQDGRREPDSGIGYTQDHRMRWTDDGWVEPDSFAPNTVQPTGRKRRAGGRSEIKRIPDGTVLRRDNQWRIPRKRALFVSDGPDSTTDILTYLTPDDHMMCMWQRNYVLRVDNWKKQWSGCSKTLQITARSSNSIGHRFRRSLLGLRNGLGLRRRQFLDFQGSRTGSNIGRCLKPLYIRMVGTTSRQLCSCFLTWTGMPST